MQNKSRIIIIVLLVVIIVLQVVLICVRKKDRSSEIKLQQGPSLENDMVVSPVYATSEFSFKYDTVRATVEIQKNSDPTMYSVIDNTGSGMNDSLVLFTGDVPDWALCTKYPNGSHSITINGKNFTYCDSSADPTRHYIYAKNGKTLTIDVGSGFTNGFVDIGSVEIN